MFKKIVSLFKRLLGYAQFGVRADYQLECAAALKKKDRRIKELEEAIVVLRSQVLHLRVSQATEGRTGWEIMAYIPEAVLKAISHNPGLRDWYETEVAQNLVRYAMKGIVKVNAEGKVNALVFAPLDIDGKPEAPKWVMAVFDKEGKYKLSDRAWIIPESEEKRVRRMR